METKTFMPSDPARVTLRPMTLTVGRLRGLQLHIMPIGSATLGSSFIDMALLTQLIS